MNIILHQTHHTISDFEGILEYLKSNINKKSQGIHVFPELFLTGYPLQDICLQKPFVARYIEFLANLKKWIKKTVNQETCVLLLGGIKYELSENGIPLSLKNVIFQAGAGKELEPVYTKRLLPNYDIFDEKKYFSKGQEAIVLEIHGLSLGVLICEDMWASSFHDIDPVQDLFDYSKNQKKDLDYILNLSASPFIIGKSSHRLNRAKEISNLFKAPFCYVNRVGGEDEILFDGNSFIVNGDEIISQAKRFKSDILTAIPITKRNSYTSMKNLTKGLTWEELFKADISVQDNGVANLSSWDDSTCQEVLEALCFGFQEYAKKNGFSKFTLALSGGMDSALVLTIMTLSLSKDQYIEAIYMPSIYSSPLSHELSLDLCKNLNIPLKSLPIKFLHSTTKNLFQQTYAEDFSGLTDENVQSRIRGMLLYTRSNQIGSMVVNTSNKSELAVGYSTQYGDSVGAISMLGDVYKSQVYRLAEYINEKFKGIIPEKIITREPSAELREGQIDKESLPPYERLDAILEGILNYRYTKSDLVKMNLPEDEVEKTLNMYKRNEYKRYQFCPIIKLSSKSFGFGYRVPLSKNTGFYNH